MISRDIFVIGASAGGFETIKDLISDLRPDFNGSIFIVWHMAPDVRGVLPEVLNGLTTLYASHPVDGEIFERGRIYVAPPDHHMIIKNDRIRITHGPKENRFRPAIDPLFRSAAFYYGPRVTGIILSGALDDGTAGLWAIKDHGGLAVVQDPYDAEVPSMPQSAIRGVSVDHIVPVSEMANLLQQIYDEKVAAEVHYVPNKKASIEERIALEDEAYKNDFSNLGELSLYTCPECHGVLTQLRNGELVRFRCHTGHAFSVESLMSSIHHNIEASLWTTIKTIQESIFLFNHMGDHFAEVNQPALAAEYFQKAKQAEQFCSQVREAVMKPQPLTK